MWNKEQCDMDIQRVIRRYGFTQQQVADKMGITRVTLNRLIQGNPTMDTLQRVANAIGCEVSEFFAVSPSLDGKVMEIDGKRYLLSLLVD